MGDGNDDDGGTVLMTIVPWNHSNITHNFLSDTHSGAVSTLPYIYGG